MRRKKVSLVRTRTNEIADEHLPLVAPVFGDGADEVLAQGLDGGEVGELARAKLLGESKFGARPQPARKVIALAVIGDALGGNPVQSFLKRSEVFGARYFGVVGPAKTKSPKAN